MNVDEKILKVEELITRREEARRALNDVETELRAMLDGRCVQVEEGEVKPRRRRKKHPYKKWTKEELEYVMEASKTMQSYEIARDLHRSSTSVRTRISKLRKDGVLK